MIVKILELILIQSTNSFKTMCGVKKSWLQNLIGNRWVTEKEIDILFRIINHKFPNTFCFVQKPDHYMEDTVKAKRDQFMQTKYQERIIVALNVGKSGQTTFVADKLRNGNHWALLILDVKSHIAYYCDSLKWEIPPNLQSSIDVHDIDKYDILPKQSNYSCWWYSFTILPCSNMCGVILMCMSVLMCEIGNIWNKETISGFLHSPCKYSRQLQLKVVLVGK